MTDFSYFTPFFCFFTFNSKDFIYFSADFSDKLISDINPGIVTKSGTVFEVAESEFDKDGWYLDVDRVKVKF